MSSASARPASARYSRPKKPKLPALMREPGGRGLVPIAGKLDQPYNEYLEGIGLRDPERLPAVELALASGNDKRFNLFLTYMDNPRYRRASLSSIAKACAIPLPQFMEFWQKAQHTRALAIAQEGITRHVVPDMVEDSRSKDMPCDRCDGFGWVYAEDGLPKSTKGLRKMVDDDPKSRQIRACPLCSGTGMVRKTGDTDSRKMLLEMSGLTNKKGSSVQITQHFGGMGIESAVERLNRVSFDLGDESVIDVEAVPASDSES